MSDWRQRMKALFQRERPRRGAEVDMAHIRETVEGYLDGTVVPAFEELRRELQQYGRTAEIDRQPFTAVLIVYHQGREEYSYAVRGRAYHKFNFAFPELGSEDAPRILRAEVLQSSGRNPEEKLEHFTRERIIRDFLDEYGKWMGWA